MITSASNKKVKDIIQLTQKAKERRVRDLFVVEGTKMFLEAPTERIEQVFVSSAFLLNAGEMILNKLHETDYEEVADDVFKKMSDTQTPQGILCTIKQFHYQFEDLFQEKGLYILLESLQDPGNLGTIFRTAEGAGINGIIMSSDTVDLYNPKTIRSTMGSIYRMPHLYTEDLLQMISKLKEQGITVYAAHLKGERYYDAFDYQKGSAFLIGNEGNGLKKETAEKASTYLKIPMEGKLESLNAAVSAAILMYEAHRQRSNS